MIAGTYYEASTSATTDTGTCSTIATDCTRPRRRVDYEYRPVFRRPPKKPFPKWKPPAPDAVAATKSNRPLHTVKPPTTVNQFQRTLGVFSRR